MRALGMRRIIAFYLAMSAVAFAALGGRGDLEALIPWTIQDAGIALLFGVSVGFGVVALSRVAANSFPWAAALTEEFRALVGDLNHREVLIAAALSSVGEEVLFRGVLQPALGLWIAAAIFGILHIGPNRRFIPWTIMAFAAGLIFGGMFMWSGSLLAPILAHFTVNYLNLRYLAQGNAPAIQLGPAGSERVSGY